MWLGRRDLLRAGTAGAAALAGCGSRGRNRSTATPELVADWTTGPDMPRPRTQTSAVALDGELYVIGGIVGDEERVTDVYDPGRGRWRTAAPPPAPINHAAALAHDDHIHVFGGYSGSFLGSPPRASHWVYAPDRDEWTDAPPLPTPRGALVAAALDGRLYAIGGADAEGTTGIVEAYDPGTGFWSAVPSLPTAREHLAAGAIGGAAYVAGGRRGLGPMVDDTERYDPTSGEWTTRAAMPTARAGIAGGVLAGRLVVCGGEAVGERVFGDVEAYHPPSDTWTALPDLPTPRWGLGVAALDGRLYTVGGGAVPSAEITGALEILSLTTE